jgi:hypothetical protein
MEGKILSVGHIERDYCEEMPSQCGSFSWPTLGTFTCFGLASKRPTEPIKIVNSKRGKGSHGSWAKAMDLIDEGRAESGHSR